MEQYNHQDSFSVNGVQPYTSAEQMSSPENQESVLQVLIREFNEARKTVEMQETMESQKDVCTEECKRRLCMGGLRKDVQLNMRAALAVSKKGGEEINREVH